MRGPRALPPTVRCLASAVSGSKPPFLARQLLIDFHSVATAMAWIAFLIYNPCR